MNLTRIAAVAVAAIALVVFGPATALAYEQVSLKTAFSPDRLGASTTIHITLNISSSTGGLPSPVTDVQIALPAGMGLGTTNLGEVTCNPVNLFEIGPRGCSPNSQMGVGSATVMLPFLPEPPAIHARIGLYMGTPRNNHTTVLLFAETFTPVEGSYLFPTELLPSRDSTFGAELNTDLGLIPTVPEGGPAVIVHMETTLGPSHLTYYRRSHGKVIPYTPEGLAVPEHCPHGGFPFRATYHFADGSVVTARAHVPCPSRGRHMR
jgi:hypothetical protein